MLLPRELRPGGRSAGVEALYADAAMVDAAPLLADNTKRGVAWCEAHSRLVDHWLTEVFEAAVGPHQDGVALVAVGGYGRSELCPQSDIDLMLVHEGRQDVSDLADRVWYPIWDAGLHLGHSVCTVREAMDIAGDELDTATALLSARPVAGDAALSARLAAAGSEHWQRGSKRLLTKLGTRVELRHETAGEVAFRLEPDLKEGRGGLRDVHSLHWVEAARRIMLEHDAAKLADAYAVLLDVRVELQRLTGRASNVLSLQDQEAVATALGLADADALMRRVAEAARLIAWTSDDTWRRVRSALRGPLGRVNRRIRTLDHGLQLRDGEIHVAEDAPADPGLVLHAASAAATHHTVIERGTLEVLAARTEKMPEPWPAATRTALIDLLSTGQWAVRVVEALDQRGIWTRVLPEWAPVRARPQRNPYHRFTVDRHLLETAANAAQLTARVSRPDLLLMAALLHDIGKGHDGDHSEVGVGLARAIATRMGFDAGDVATLEWLVARHLLLADVAMRRDLADDTTIKGVAAAVESTARLELLAALTEADSLATGPAAWGPTKARLVDELVQRVRAELDGDGAAPDISYRRFPEPEQLAGLAEPGTRVATEGNVLVVMTDDRPGTFSRVAGVLALHGLDVVTASAYSSDDGRALSEFEVADPVRREIPWDRVESDLELALDGRLALPARLAERARTYGADHRRHGLPASITVRFDDGASADATVIDVHAPDGVGVLYRITRAFADLDLDIRSARVQTLGHDVVDAFYVRDRHGAKITDPHLRGEIERALVHGVSD
jgi:[protein-PII] uridylyltransferase